MNTNRTSPGTPAATKFGPTEDPESMTDAQRNMIAASQIPDSLLNLPMPASPTETDPNSRELYAT